MKQLRKKKPKTTSDAGRAAPGSADDFVSVARRLGADENKARFEAKLGKIAKAKPPAEK